METILPNEPSGSRTAEPYPATRPCPPTTIPPLFSQTYPIHHQPRQIPHATPIRPHARASIRTAIPNFPFASGWPSPHPHPDRPPPLGGKWRSQNFLETVGTRGVYPPPPPPGVVYKFAVLVYTTRGGVGVVYTKRCGFLAYTPHGGGLNFEFLYTPR